MAGGFCLNKQIHKNTRYKEVVPMPLKDTFDKAKEAGINLAGKAWEKGSDLAGKAWEKGSDFADRAKEKAKSTARIAKLNFEIKAEENTIEKAYREIGRLY